jgi:uncharacterized lipoprotein YmbA
MSMRILPASGALVWLIAALLLGGCLVPSKTAILYSLQPMHQQALRHTPHRLPGMVLLMPVQVAPQLQGRNLLYLQPSGETRNPAGHLWSASLERQIGQRMTVQLQDLLATTNVALYPGPRFGNIRYQVEIELQEFSGDDRTFSTLATYTLSDTTTKANLMRKTFRQNRTIDNPGYSGYVTSASHAVADLSKEVALALLAIHPPTSSAAPCHEN